MNSQYSLYKTDLTFNIMNRTLSGLLNGHQILMAVNSGGGSGKSKGRSPEDIWASNNSFATDQKTVKKKNGTYVTRGGPIPPGVYTLGIPEFHPSLSKKTMVVPIVKGFVENMERDGFYIHGRGDHGSDGCLVPVNPADLHRLIEEIRKSGGGILRVISYEFELKTTIEGYHVLP